jgi:pyruvate/2-oxoglutarate dehydrogenase complex dihydrolipoamide dehydrogenase (E3) component
MAASGVQVVEDAGTIDRFERCATGVRLTHSTSDGQHSLDATLAVVAAGWVAATAWLDLDRTGVQTDRRGYVQVDAHLRTTAPHVFAAGDITGRPLMRRTRSTTQPDVPTCSLLGYIDKMPSSCSCDTRTRAAPPDRPGPLPAR